MKKCIPLFLCLSIITLYGMESNDKSPILDTKLNTKLKSAARKMKHKKMIKYLDKGADINTLDLSGKSLTEILNKSLEDALNSPGISGLGYIAEPVEERDRESYQKCIKVLSDHPY